jgi:hypothetical protein
MYLSKHKNLDVASLMVLAITEKITILWSRWIPIGHSWLLTKSRTSSWREFKSQHETINTFDANATEKPESLFRLML